VAILAAAARFVLKTPAWAARRPVRRHAGFVPRIHAFHLGQEWMAVTGTAMTQKRIEPGGMCSGRSGPARLVGAAPADPAP
jgi:hypothetical protein